jgi:hypothetical protein
MASGGVDSHTIGPVAGSQPASWEDAPDGRRIGCSYPEVRGWETLSSSPGLGLSMTYDIVTKQHGGTIAIESELGAYTEFTFTNPRVEAAPQ